MYEAFFGLQENPFTLSPDPKYLYLSDRHREALNYLVYGIQERKGFVVVTGDIGAGKTTLCRALLSSLNGSVETALIFNSFLSEIELLETINQEFGLPPETGERSRKRLLDALNAYLLANYGEGKNAVLLIDESQNLSHGVLEQIRMISNLETVREKLIQIVLIGQPELQDVLAMPALRQLNERITVRYHLGPLERADVGRYIEHRLAVAGRGRAAFTPWSYRTIYRYSQGVPRRINTICDRALLIAYTREKVRIGAGLVRRAVRDLGGYGETGGVSRK
jgi:general secretion pathway protein A